MSEETLSQALFSEELIFEQPSQLPAQSLAYVGDAVYELYIRERILKTYRAKAGRLHALSIRLARASYQAKAALVLQDKLSEDEQRLLLRGRNADPGSMAKNASPQDYRWASGLETLLGFLYLDKQYERLYELLKEIYELEME